jgi:hypothetical protein
VSEQTDRKLLEDAGLDVNRAIIRVLTRELDNLAGASMDDRGQPKAPDRKALMRARSMLPAGSRHTLNKGDARMDAKP